MNKEIGGGGGADGGYSGGGSGGSRPSSSSWRWTLGVREAGPPPFLTKTYSIVDDPNTNSIISWGKFGNSFIIWDHLQFSEDILPKYFRHSNLSSFVYQLNNYGFRKIGTDHQWEYENPHFQAGKIHLLTNIKRRGQNPEITTNRRTKRTLFDSIKPEILMNETNESKQEIERLKKEQADMEFHIMALEEEVKNVENKTKKLIMHWAKACEIIAENMREETGKENNDDEAKNKRKLDANAYSEAVLEKNSADYTYWKTILLEDDDNDEAYEGETGSEMAKQQAEITMDLEELIMKLDDRDHDQ